MEGSRVQSQMWLMAEMSYFTLNPVPSPTHAEEGSVALDVAVLHSDQLLYSIRCSSTPQPAGERDT